MRLGTDQLCDPQPPSAYARSLTAGGDRSRARTSCARFNAARAPPDGALAPWVRGHEMGGAHAHKARNDRADRLAVAASHAKPDFGGDARRPGATAGCIRA